MNSEIRAKISRLDNEQKRSRIKDIELEMSTSYLDMHSGAGPGLSVEDLEKRNTERYHLLASLAAIPEEFNQMRMWMFEVHGSSEINLTRELAYVFRGGLDDETLDEVSAVDPMIKRVLEFLKSTGLPILDSEGIVTEWMFGVLCSNAEYDVVYEKFMKEFGKLASYGILHVQRVFWGFQFPGSEFDDDDSDEMEIEFSPE